MAVVILVVAILVATGVHEAGHWLAVRIEGGHVVQLRVGRGAPLWQTERDGARYVLGTIPLGGRIRYRGIHARTAHAVITVSGAVANLLFAFLVLLLAASVAGAPAMPLSGPEHGAFGYATATVSTWIWLVPGTLADLVTGAGTVQARWALRALLDVVARGNAVGGGVRRGGHLRALGLAQHAPHPRSGHGRVAADPRAGRTPGGSTGVRGRVARTRAGE